MLKDGRAATPLSRWSHSEKVKNAKTGEKWQVIENIEY